LDINTCSLVHGNWNSRRNPKSSLLRSDSWFLASRIDDLLDHDLCIQDTRMDRIHSKIRYALVHFLERDHRRRRVGQCDAHWKWIVKSYCEELPVQFCFHFSLQLARIFFHWLVFDVWISLFLFWDEVYLLRILAAKWMRSLWY
jgi:hypothetical protein